MLSKNNMQMNINTRGRTTSRVDTLNNVNIDILEYTSVYMNLNNNETWLQHLYRNGWTTVKIPDYDTDYFKNKLYNWIESLSPEFYRNNQNYKHIPYNNKGIFQNYIGHDDFMWKTREKCFPIYKEILGTDNLLSSFDGACFLQYKKQDSWLHLDQSRYENDRFCSVQGLVTLTNSSPNDGGIIIIRRI